ncbi:stage II sporulation protein D [Mycoplasmatota bacterium zrk1]
MKSLLLRFLIIALMTYMIPGIIYVFFGEDQVEEVIDEQIITASLLEPYENVTPDIEIEVPVGVFEEDYCNYDLRSEEIDNSVEITLLDDGIEILGLDTYIIGVLAEEMDPTWPCEALKAQSIAARTYVLKQLDRSGYIMNSTLHQVYKSKEEMREDWGTNYDAYYNRLRNVVLSTKYDVLAYKNDYIDAVYFSSSNGYTQNAEYVWKNEIPYLKSVPSPWDDKLTNIEKEYRFTVGEFISIFNKHFSTDIEYLSDIKVVRSSSGIFSSVEYKNQVISSEQLRNAFGLRSPVFGLEHRGNLLYVTTYGYGHLVGLSQYGAYGMALEGFSYYQILNHYYKDVEIVDYNYIKF